MTKEIQRRLHFLLILLLTIPLGLFAQFNSNTLSVGEPSLYSFENMSLAGNRLMDNYFAEFSSNSRKKSSKKDNRPLRDNFGLNYISFSIGPSAPIGKYSQGAIDSSFIKGTSFDFPPSALLGLQLSVDGAFYFTKHFGVGAMGGYSFHPFDTTLIDQLVDYSPYIAQVRASTYNNFFFFVGPCFGTGSDDVFFEVKAMIGVYHSSPFNLEVKQVYDTSYSIDLKYSAPGSTQLGVLIGADLRYKLNPFLAMLFKVDFIFSTQHYPMTVIDNVSQNGNVFPTQRSTFLHQNGATQVAPSIGIAYILNNESPKPGAQQGQPSKKDGYYYK